MYCFVVVTVNLYSYEVHHTLPKLHQQTGGIFYVVSGRDCRCFLRVVLQYTCMDRLLLPRNFVLTVSSPLTKKDSVLP